MDNSKTAQNDDTTIIVKTNMAAALPAVKLAKE